MGFLEVAAAGGESPRGRAVAEGFGDGVGFLEIGATGREDLGRNGVRAPGHGGSAPPAGGFARREAR